MRVQLSLEPHYPRHKQIDDSCMYPPLRVLLVKVYQYELCQH